MRSIVLPDDPYALEMEERCEADFKEGGEPDEWFRLRVVGRERLWLLSRAWACCRSK